MNEKYFSVENTLSHSLSTALLVERKFYKEISVHVCVHMHSFNTCCHTLGPSSLPHSESSVVEEKNCPDDGGRKHFRNVGKLLPDYTVLQPGRQPSSKSMFSFSKYVSQSSVLSRLECTPHWPSS
jgi:hypothetical protein